MQQHLQKNEDMFGIIHFVFYAGTSHTTGFAQQA